MQLTNVQRENYRHFAGSGLFPSLYPNSGSVSLDDEVGFLLQPNPPQIVDLRAKGRLPKDIESLLQMPRHRYSPTQTNNFLGRFDLQTGRRIAYIDCIDNIPVQSHTTHK